jgi:hypothetical protein
VVGLVECMTPWDWVMVFRIAWGGNLAETVAGLVEGRDRDDDDHGDDMDWSQIVDEISRERHLTYEQVLDLYFVQVTNMIRQGKPAVGRSGLSVGSPIGLIRSKASREQVRRALARELAWYDEGEALPSHLAEARAIVEGWDAERPAAVAG